MTDITVTTPTVGLGAAPRPLLGWAVADAISVTWRNLKSMSRQPGIIVFSTIQPIIFVLTWRYVFGNAINAPGDYVDFLMPGIFVQTVAFGAMNTGVGLADDLQKGLVERFRSLPMARSAVLAGRTAADLVRNVLVVLLMIVMGVVVGWDYHTNMASVAGAFLVLLAFAFAFSWVLALVGLAVPNVEAAQAATFPLVAVLVFASSAFVPIDTMPGWLQAYNEVQPVSVTVEAVRALCLGGPTQGAVLGSLAWSAALVAVFASLAVARYRKAA